VQGTRITKIETLVHIEPYTLTIEQQFLTISRIEQTYKATIRGLYRAANNLMTQEDFKMGTFIVLD